MSPRACVIVAVALLAATGANALKAGGASIAAARKAQKAPAGSLTMPVQDLVAPLHFSQRLLLCNAYPSDSPMVVQKNGGEMLADENDAISFGECRYISNRVQRQDKLNLGLRDTEMAGTFEVGELPESDAVLLLVLEKRSGSPMVSFQSFALPVSSDNKDAQLAVINAFAGNHTSSPRLKMEDHVEAKEAQTISKRVEELNFNRVYSVEAGSYDLSIADGHQESDLAQRRTLKLAGGSNYVILRTGGGHFKESLVVFPDAPYRSHAYSLSAALAFAFTILALVF